MIQTVRSNIRSILKTDIATADCTNGATLVGCNIIPDYYGLDMVVALAFRIQSYRAEIFRKWVLRRCTVSSIQLTVIQDCFARTRIEQQN